MPFPSAVQLGWIARTFGAFGLPRGVHGDAWSERLARLEVELFSVLGGKAPPVRAFDALVPIVGPAYEKSSELQQIDAETLLVHPWTAEIFIVTKWERPPVVYRFPMPLRAGRRVTLERVATLPGIAPALTAGAVAPDGHRMVVRDYTAAFEYRLPTGRPFREIFARRPVPVTLARERQGEAITYRRDGRALLTLPAETLAWLVLAACEALIYEPPAAAADRLRLLLELTGHAPPPA